MGMRGTRMDCGRLVRFSFKGHRSSRGGSSGLSRNDKYIYSLQLQRFASRKIRGVFSLDAAIMVQLPQCPSMLLVSTDVFGRAVRVVSRYTSNTCYLTISGYHQVFLSSYSAFHPKYSFVGAHNLFEGFLVKMEVSSQSVDANVQSRSRPIRASFSTTLETHTKLFGLIGLSSEDYRRQH